MDSREWTVENGKKQPWHITRWMDSNTPVEQAAHIAQTRSIPTEEFMWWRVDRAVNRPDPNNNGKHLLAPIGSKDNETAI
jgi:hypothetical protein